jgi:hypothetical protein
MYHQFSKHPSDASTLKTAGRNRQRVAQPRLPASTNTAVKMNELIPLDRLSGADNFRDARSVRRGSASGNETRGSFDLLEAGQNQNLVRSRSVADLQTSRSVSCDLQACRSVDDLDSTCRDRPLAYSLVNESDEELYDSICRSSIAKFQLSRSAQELPVRGPSDRTPIDRVSDLDLVSSSARRFPLQPGQSLNEAATGSSLGAPGSSPPVMRQSAAGKPTQKHIPGVRESNRTQVHNFKTM